MNGLRKNGTSPMTTQLILAAAVCFTPGAVHAADGDLDPTFGDAGIVITQFPDAWDQGYFGAKAVAIQPDGKIVAAGGDVATGGQFALSRYNADGSLDTTFGRGGMVTTRVGVWCGSGATTVAIQADGKIVAGGSVINTSDYPFSSDLALVRYDSNGSLDPAFGNGGVVIRGSPGVDELGNAIAIQSDGKIVLAGQGENLEFLVVRFNSDGAIDTDFGGTLVRPHNSDIADAVVIQSDGKIVAVGGPWGGGYGLAVRINVNGTLDNTFGSGGLVSLGFDSNAVAVQPDGRIVIAGQAYTAAMSDHALQRLNSDGTPDSTFGGGGVVTTEFYPLSDNRALGIALQADKIVTAGYAGYGAEYHFALARYNADGSLDPTFGGGGLVGTPGLVTTPIKYNSRAYGLAVQADGKIVTVGNTHLTDFGSPGAFAVTRHLGSPTPAQAIQQLLSTVISLNLSAGIENSLDSKLAAVSQALNDTNQNNNVAAINSLQAFINAVNAQRGAQITGTDADALVAAAQAIIAQLQLG